VGPAEPKYTEYAGAPHWMWFRAWKEPGVIDWLYKQKLPAPPKGK